MCGVVAKQCGAVRCGADKCEKRQWCGWLIKSKVWWKMRRVAGQMSALRRARAVSHMCVAALHVMVDE